MGSAASKERKFFRPFDAGEFTVAWLTFKGDATEDEAHRLMARKDGLLSSKLLRGLFGDATMKCLEQSPGECITKEAFVCTLALCYVGNTEDRISYLFTMYSIIYSAERDEGFIYETDYLYLLEHLEGINFVPKKFYAAFEECLVPMGGTLTNAQFVDWVRQYPTLMDYLASHLPPSPLPSSPLSIRTTDDPNVDPLNHSPSCRLDKLKAGSGSASGGGGGHFSSFDFLGGEDSGDDDSDELYDSDQISEMESYNDGAYSDSHDDTAAAQAHGHRQDIGVIVSHDDDDDDRQSARAAPPTPLSVGGMGDHGFGRSGARAPGAAALRSRGVQKMGRNIGKAVGGGISKVGRSILHVGKSQVHSTSAANAANGGGGGSGATAKAGSASEPVDPGAASLIAAGYAFSSESQTSKSYVCGYLHKVSDGKWSKRSWHRRWFVLDKQLGVLSYYRHNPANLISAAPHGNVVHMDASDDDDNREARDHERGVRDDTESGRDASPPKSQYEQQPDVSGSSRATATKTATEMAPVDTSHAAGDKPHNLLYLCKNHPWYRGEFDLNADNVSLLFEKSLAKSAPTSYFFQVSTLALHEIDSKRGVQYKLCADNEADFDLWTHAIATAINRKHSQSASQRQAAPVLSHQQLYRQRLLQEQHEQEQQQQQQQESVSHASTAVITPTSSIEGDSASSRAVAGSATTTSTHSPTEPAAAASSPAAAPPLIVKPVPPPIITSYHHHHATHISERSPWRLQVTIEGTKPCLILGFVVNMVAMKCLASEYVVSKCLVCVVVTAAYVASIYNPRALASNGRDTGGWDAAARSTGGAVSLSTDAAQCVDPTACCLHREPAIGETRSGTPGSGSGSGGASASGGQLNPSALHGASPLGRAVTKFAMASSMTRTYMNESGRSTNVPHSWATTRGETFSVRSIDYKKTRRKEPSRPALFEFVGCDLIRTDGKVDLISQRVELPDELAADKLFIINAQLPAYAPSVWGDASSNGPGFSLVLYWKIPPSVLEELKDPQTPALRLLQRFLRAGSDTSLTDRFKVIAQVTNQDECGVTGMGKKLLASHNATPVLTRPQHRIYHFGGSTELVVDIHAFSYIARRGIHLLLDKTAKLVIDIGFVLQGETDDELPEQILGCCRLDHADVQHAMDMPR